MRSSPRDILLSCLTSLYSSLAVAQIHASRLLRRLDLQLDMERGGVRVVQTFDRLLTDF